MTLSVKDVVKKKTLPAVFCCNDIGGHLGVLVDLPWNTQYASHAIRKAFEKANIKNITAYALRRFFIQKAQTLADDSKVASLAGHHPNSAVQYTEYGSTFSTLDIVKLIQDSKLEDMNGANKFIEGVRCTQHLSRKMTKEEYEQEIAPFIEQENKDLEAVVASMKESYGTEYKMAYRRYKNAQDRYRRKGLKKLSEERQKKALEEMKVDENGAVITDAIEEDKQNNKF